MIINCERQYPLRRKFNLVNIFKIKKKEKIFIEKFKDYSVSFFAYTDNQRNTLSKSNTSRKKRETSCTTIDILQKKKRKERNRERIIQ